MTDLAVDPSLEQTRPDEATTRRRPKRRLLLVLCVVVGLLAGVWGAYFVFREPARPTHLDGAPSVDSIDLPAQAATGVTAPPAVQPAEIAEPASARAALDAYLEAESSRRYDVSFSLVDAAAREKAGTVAAWQSLRPQRLLPETYVVRSERRVAGGVELTLDAARTPLVDAVSGFVPARSSETWLVSDNGGWRVVGGSPVDVRPVLPPDESAAAVAGQWLSRARACDPDGATALQLSRSLLGSPALRDLPCESGGDYRPGRVIAGSELQNSTVFVSAFGPGVGRWSRAVPVSGAGRFTIVLAPLGDEWRVMGVVPEGSPRP